MEFEVGLSIISLAVAVGGLTHALYMAESRRSVTLSIVVCAVIVILVFWGVRHEGHENKVHDAMTNVLAVLKPWGISFDELYAQVNFIDAVTLREALDRLIDQGKVSSSIEPVHFAERIVRVRLYSK